MHEMIEQKKLSFLGIYKKRLFELMAAVYQAYPEKNMVTWLVIAVETVQLTFYPLRRAVPSSCTPVVPRILDADGTV